MHCHHPAPKLELDVILQPQLAQMRLEILAEAFAAGIVLAGDLEPDVDALIDRDSWTVPPLFRFLQKHGGVDDDEMDRVFNMGVGYCLVVRPTFADAVAKKLQKAGETVFRMGEITPGSGVVRYR